MPANTLWRQLVEQKASSIDPAQRKAFLLGLNSERDIPILLPREALVSGHLHVSGRIGAGKTASVLLPLALQILEGYPEATGKPSRKCPLLILDLKGDLALFHAVREAAEGNAQTFRCFSLRPGDDYHFFDPFHLFQQGRQNAIELATSTVRSLGLDYGMVYGGLYFTDQNTELLLQGIKRMVEMGGEPTLDRLNSVVTKLARSSAHLDARHIKSILDFLAEYPQLNRSLHDRMPARTIDFERFLDESEVIYFFLQLQLQANTQRQAPLFALFSLVTAALARKQLNRPPTECFVLIDEFYHIAGRSFGELLTAVRHAGLRFVLANQTRAQLVAHDQHLPQVVRANAAAEILFDITEREDVEYLQQLAGRRKVWMNSYSRLLSNPDHSMSEIWDQSLTPETINEITARPQHALLVARDALTAPEHRWVQPLHTLFPISLGEYSDYNARPYPPLATTSSYSVTTAHSVPAEAEQVEVKRSAPKAGPRPAKAGKVAALLHPRYRELWDELEQLERYDEEPRKDKRP